LLNQVHELVFENPLQCFKPVLAPDARDSHIPVIILEPIE